MNTRRIFITGTDTGVGKTHFTVWCIRQLQAAGLVVGAYKPVCSGALSSAVPSASAETPAAAWDDAERLAAALEHRWPLERIAPQCFLAPLAPPVAAALEAREVDEQLLLTGADWWTGRVDVLLIEGAGGWLSPVSTNSTNADLAARLEADVILVAGNRLGVINHALLTIDSIRRTSKLLGIVLNELSPSVASAGGFDSVQSNFDEIGRRSGLALWGRLSHGDEPQLKSRGEPVNIVWGELLRDGN